MKHNFLTKLLTVLLFSSFISISYAQKRLIALTIDDLPFVGEEKNFHLNMIIDALKANEVPATGFVIASNVSPNNWDTLKKFREAGLGIGNHTLNHINLNKVKTQAYIQEIDDADKVLLPVLTEPKFFRYPYLAMSNGEKKNTVISFLAAKNYQIAPVTIDSKDFVFNQLLLSVQEKDRRGFLGVLRDCYLKFIWEQTLLAEEHNIQANKPNRPQILLIHANLLNAYVLPDIINLYRQNGFTFVSLERALRGFPGTPKVAVKEEQPIPEKLEPEQMNDMVAWD
ncbi:polysaccharide deacetylase (plasmid) [Legionella adelaidensis]|uniref:Polysaccharide deacetylase n=1 Tax=Legionella adelaidensis TaxID=45056 RepID=A0A0W0R493_9GAMM|nr:polysaccharide deacetylase family protein [Legionella adelaidensis]KTC65865.1 polysaccharide deacetylase [Legionella adelaidensis]VEH85295.1 polysaccharide deacetylase [Legionella adelaidensis]